MISNATPLICLSKINKLWFLKKCFDIIIIPNAVKEEVLVEDKGGYSVIKDAIEEGWIKVAEPRNRIDYGLGKGENAAINLAHEKKDKVIIDDSVAIKVAKSLNIEVIRTTSTLFIAVQKNIIDKKEALILLNNLIEIGYYISPKYYSILFDKLRE